MTDNLVKRLRGEYRVQITDGFGAVGSGSEPDNPCQYVRHFETAQIQHEAADRIEELERQVEEWKQRCVSVFVAMISIAGDTKEEKANIRAIFESPEELLAGEAERENTNEG
jgi:lipase chaperone LimK